MTGDTNLKVLRPSRKAPRPGDVFVVHINDGYYAGRVISDRARASWTGGFYANLIYIFRPRLAAPEVPPIEVLRPTNLLVSPLMTNRLPWSRGYLQTLTNIPLDAAAVLPMHCFETARGDYVDENAAPIPRRVEPCSHWGLHSFRSIDDELSAALGIPPAPFKN